LLDLGATLVSQSDPTWP